jgi:hypothetical protein
MWLPISPTYIQIVIAVALSVCYLSGFFFKNGEVAKISVCVPARTKTNVGEFHWTLYFIKGNLVTTPISPSVGCQPDSPSHSTGPINGSQLCLLSTEIVVIHHNQAIVPLLCITWGGCKNMAITCIRSRQLHLCTSVTLTLTDKASIYSAGCPPDKSPE